MPIELAFLGGALAVAGVCMVVCPLWLSRAAWPTRRPQLGLGLWLSAFLGGLLACFASIAGTVVLAVADSGGPNAHRGWALSTALVLAAWTALISVGALTAIVLARAEPLSATHADLAWNVDLLVATSAYRRVRLPDVEVCYIRCDAPIAVALPTGRRVVVASRLVEELQPLELRAVIEHERAHLSHRHDRLVRLARLNAACLPRFFGATALERCVDALIEVAADDTASRVVGRAATTSALTVVGTLTDQPSMLARAERLATLPARSTRRPSVEVQHATDLR